MRPICEACGESEAPDEGVYVDQRPNGNGRELLCNDCYGKRLADRTGLDDQEAAVWALQDSGLTHAEIARELDIPNGEVRALLTDAVKQREDAEALVALTTTE